jgi:hypothetical protein
MRSFESPGFALLLLLGQSANAPAQLDSKIHVMNPEVPNRAKAVDVAKIPTIVPEPPSTTGLNIMLTTGPDPRCSSLTQQQRRTTPGCRGEAK